MVKEVNWLGDLVISLPALHAVRRRYAGAHLAVVIRAELAGFFDGIAWIDEVITYQTLRGAWRIGTNRRLIDDIRSRRFDLAILFPNSFSSALIATLAGVPRRAGYSTDGRGLLLTDRTRPDEDALAGHQKDYWLRMVRATVDAEYAAAGLPDDVALTAKEDHRTRIAATIEARRTRPGAPLIAIAPAAAYGPAKEWPADRFVALVDLLGDRYGAESVVVGAPGETALCERIVAAASPSAAFSMAGETAVGELIALLSVCDGFAGNDSGAMHLASALGIPTVGIFGSTNPARTGPFGPRATVVSNPLDCSPCLARTCRFGHYRCLGEIAPVAVAAALASTGAFGRSRRPVA